MNLWFRSTRFLVRRRGVLNKLVLTSIGIALLGGCDGAAPTHSNIGIPGDGDTIHTPPLPPDSTPTDSVPGTPGDSVVPPPDSSGPDLPPAGTPVHVGIPFGPYNLPAELYGQEEFNGAFRPRWSDTLLLDHLEAARRANTRVLVNMTGAERHLVDKNGFSFEKWKARVDGYRNIDFSSYIADGTVIGHFLMDEPNDASNWHGKKVSPEQIDMLAKYSKDIWPSLPTVVRARPDYLKGYRFQYLDAAWAQYLDRFGSLDAFIETNVRDAKEAGLALVGGLNVINGGSSKSGIPGRKAGKFAMSANEVRTWGSTILAQPYFCAFIMWEYESKYFSRDDIRAAFLELKAKAEAHPKQPCRRAS